MIILELNFFKHNFKINTAIISTQHFLAPKEAYRPPCARGQNITFKLHDDLEAPSKSTECKYTNAYKRIFHY